MLFLYAGGGFLGFVLILLVNERLQPIFLLNSLVDNSAPPLQLNYFTDQVAVNKVSASRIVKKLLFVIAAILIARALVHQRDAAVGDEGVLIPLLLVEHVNADEIRVLFIPFV